MKKVILILWFYFVIYIFRLLLRVLIVPSKSITSIAKIKSIGFVCIVDGRPIEYIEEYCTLFISGKVIVYWFAIGLSQWFWKIWSSFHYFFIPTLTLCAPNKLFCTCTYVLMVINICRMNFISSVETSSILRY